MADIAELPTTAESNSPAEIPLPGYLHPNSVATRITAETAAKFHALNAEKRKTRLEKIRRAREADEIPSDWVQDRLRRAREHLARLDKLFEAEASKAKPEAKTLKEYADAMARLQTQEQQLSGRPLPGSRKPAPDRVPRVNRDVGPLDD